MAKAAGQLVVNISAGTSKFIVDIEQAKGKIREFGTTSKSSMAASSAALRELEGNFANKIGRAHV